MRARAASLRSEAVADATPSAASLDDGLRIDRTLRDFVRNLDCADTIEDIGKSLAALGAVFHMPNVCLLDKHGGNGAEVAAFSNAPATMRRAAATLIEPAIVSAFRKAKGAVALSELPNLLGSNWNRPQVLAGVEAVATSAELDANAGLLAIFFGKRGEATGLSKSVLFLGAHLAANKRAGSSPRRETARATTERAMTERERQIVDLAKSGHTDGRIGKMLGISTRTVRFHVANATRKVGAGSRAQLIAKSSQRS